MICPLLHKEPISSFAELHTQEGIEVRVCARCGLVFVPKESRALATVQIKESRTKQILKWP